MQLWATSRTCLILALIAPGCYARSITVDGTVLLEDGQPVKSGHVVVTEYTGPEGRMPNARRLATLTTDGDGKFHTELSDVRGAIDVGLERDRCSWTWASKIISWKDLKTKDHFEITLNTKHDHCEGRGGS